VKRQSDKRARLQRAYVAWVQSLAIIDDRCEVGPLISKADPTYRGCAGRMGGLHHKQKRSANKARIMDPTNVLRSCNPCNGHVEDHPPEGGWPVELVTRPGDPDWQEPG
jgi:hypothetical protein